MLKRRTPLILLSVLLSAFLLAVLFRTVSPAELFGTMASLYLPALLGYAALSLATAFLRAWRYRILLRPAAIAWGDIFLATLVRNAFDDLLPARVGSLSYLYVLNDRLEKPFENAANSFVVSLVYDFLTLGPFVLLALLTTGGGASGIPAKTLVVVAAAFTAAVVLVAWRIAFFVRLARDLSLALVKRTPWARNPKVVRAFESFDRTVAVLRERRSRGEKPAVFLLSLLIRLGKYLSLFVLLYAVLRSEGVAWAGMSFWKTVLGLTGAEMTAVLPLKGLAGFGTWESAWAAALLWMGFDPRLAVLSGLGVHLATNLFEYALALGSLAVLAFRRKRDRMGRNP